MLRLLYCRLVGTRGRLKIESLTQIIRGPARGDSTVFEGTSNYDPGTSRRHMPAPSGCRLSERCSEAS